MVIVLTKYMPLVSTNTPEIEERISFNLKNVLNSSKHDGFAKTKRFALHVTSL